MKADVLSNENYVLRCLSDVYKQLQPVVYLHVFYKYIAWHSLVLVFSCSLMGKSWNEHPI